MIIIGGKGKIAVYDSSTNDITITADGFGIDNIKGLEMINVKNLFCIDQSNLYCLYVNDNKMIELLEKEKHIDDNITGLTYRPKRDLLIIDEQSSIKQISFEEDNWIVPTPLFTFKGKTY